MSNSKLTPEEKAKALRLLDGGMTQTAVAKRLGVSISVIHYLAKEARVV